MASAKYSAGYPFFELESNSEQWCAKGSFPRDSDPIASKRPHLVLQFPGQPFEPKQKREHRQMDRVTIIAELEAERDRLDSAIAALRSSQRGHARTLSGKPDGRSRKRHLSAAARKRIGEAMKKRWAEKRKASKKK